MSFQEPRHHISGSRDNSKRLEPQNKCVQTNVTWKNKPPCAIVDQWNHSVRQPLTTTIPHCSWSTWPGWAAMTTKLWQLENCRVARANAKQAWIFKIKVCKLSEEENTCDKFTLVEPWVPSKSGWLGDTTFHYGACAEPFCNQLGHCTQTLSVYCLATRHISLNKLRTELTYRYAAKLTS